MKNQKGFTLIEIMLVVVIISILVGVVLPRLTGKTEKARVSATKLQMQAVELAMDSFEMDAGRYPTTSEGLEALLRKPANIKNWFGPYMKKGVPNDAWAQPYVYTYPSRHSQDYDLMSVGPDTIAGSEDDITNWK